MKAYSAIAITVVVLAGLSGCGDKPVDGKILSVVGAKCDQGNSAVKVGFYDTIIPENENIKKKDVCNAANDLYESTLNEQIQAVEQMLPLICDRAEDAIKRFGTEESAKEELKRMAGNSRDPDVKMGVAAILKGIDLCGDKNAQKQEAVDLVAAIGLKLYSVGTIKEPSSGKSCFAYLGETTYSHNGKVKHAIPFLHALGCGSEVSKIQVKDDSGNVINVSNNYGDHIKQRYAYTGDIPEKAIFDYESITYFTGNKSISTAHNQPSVETITEAELHQFYAERHKEFLAAEKSNIEQDGQIFDEKTYDRPSVQIAFIGKTEIGKYPIAIATTPRRDIEATDIDFFTKIDGVLYRVWFYFRYNLLSIEATPKETIISYLGDTPDDKHTDKWVYIAGQIKKDQSIEPDFYRCWNNMPIHVPLLNQVPYDAARKRLIAEGWKPSTQNYCNGSADYDHYDYCAKGYSEVESCGMLGASATCTLVWVTERGDQLDVSTSSGVIDSLDTTCRNPPPPMPTTTAPKAPSPMPMSGGSGAEKAVFQLSQTIVSMESSPNPRCRSMANQLWKRLEMMDKLLQQGQMFESRAGHDGGRYNQAIHLAQQTEMQIAQYGCSR